MHIACPQRELPSLPAPLLRSAPPRLPRAPPLQVKERPVNETWFSDRSPVVTAPQSAVIVQALRDLGIVDALGYLVDDPRMGLKASGHRRPRAAQRHIGAAGGCWGLLGFWNWHTDCMAFQTSQNPAWPCKIAPLPSSPPAAEQDQPDVGLE